MKGDVSTTCAAGENGHRVMARGRVHRAIPEEPHAVQGHHVHHGNGRLGLGVVARVGHPDVARVHPKRGEERLNVIRRWIALGRTPLPTAALGQEVGERNVEWWPRREFSKHKTSTPLYGSTLILDSGGAIKH